MSMPVTSSGSSGSSSSSSSVTNSSMSNLSPTNFVQFLITEMQNQDPLNPTSSDTMLQELSEIGQLQSSTTLDTDLQGVMLQNQVGSASSLIGKEVAGTDSNNNKISGVVSSVQVNSTGVGLVLSDGSSLGLSGVTSIAEPSTSTSSTSGS